MRLRNFLSRQSTPRLLGWILKGSALACTAGLILSGLGMSQAFKQHSATVAGLASEKAVAAKTTEELAGKPKSLQDRLPQDSLLGQDQYLASFIEELGLLSEEAGCTVVSVQSGPVSVQSAPQLPPGMAEGQAQGAVEAAQAAMAQGNAPSPQPDAAMQPEGAGEAPRELQATSQSAWEEMQLDATLRGDFLSSLRLLDALGDSGKVCAVRGFEMSRSTVDQDSRRVKVQLKLSISIFKRA